MTYQLRHIAIVLLAATVLVSATGVNVHRLYCYCKGEVTASIFRPNNPCELQKADCCKGKTCGKTGHDCTDCTSKYVKLDADYLLFPLDFKLCAPQVFAVANCFSERKTTLIKQTPTWHNDLPPPPYGKMLLPHIQSFLC